MGVGKKILIGLGIALLIIVLVFFAWQFLKGPIPAELRDAQGVVEVKTGDAWVAASQGTKLKQGNGVRTQEGSATIVFFGGNILRLDANTEVQITELDAKEARVAITQSSGKSWHRVIKKGNPLLERAVKVNGLTGYAVKLPVAVATVRGTSFSTNAEAPNGVSVVIGTVDVSTATDQESLTQQTATIVDNTIQVQKLVPDPWIEENMQKDKQFGQALLAEIRSKYGFAIDYVKKQYGLTDEQIDKAILDYLASGKPLPEIPES